jgi:hypothetical protein
MQRSNPGIGADLAIQPSRNLSSKVDDRYYPEEHTSAFIIQAWWRHKRITKALAERIASIKRKLRIYTSSISGDQAVHSRTKRVEFGCQAAGFIPVKIDLVVNKVTSKTETPSRRKDIPLYSYRLPVVMVDQYCLGEEPDFQGIISSDLLQDIVEEGSPE